MASWLAGSSPDVGTRVQALAGDIVLCSWERHSLHPGLSKVNAGGGSRNTPLHLMQTLPFTFDKKDYHLQKQMY